MKKLYMIGNAHLDPVWLWPWQEGFQENKATCRSALDRLKEFDNVAFTSSSAQFYEWIEQNDPAMFAEIAARVREGRWVLCGGWWVQPDCNIPGGEAFARHGLISQNYFQEKFGVTAKTGYNVDSFGHNGMLPQILKLSGMENYVFMRPHPHEKELPARNFIWESADGSRVQTFRLPISYNVSRKLEEHLQKCREEFDAGVDELMCFYGVGNHGGGPTIENLRTIQRLQKEWTDVEILFSDPDAYFADLKEKYSDFPVVHGDLQHHASGCYSAHSQIKMLNRRAENALLRAEKFSALSEVLTGVSCPGSFTEGWKRVLFNQFHDTLAGSAIERAYEDAGNDYGEALSIAARNENNGLQAISFGVQIEPEDDMKPLVVFNPHSWPVTEQVEIETGAFSTCCPGHDYRIKDDLGNVVPSQLVTPEATALNRKRIVFSAQVPALGYRTYRLYGLQEAPAEAPESGTSESLTLENEKLKVVFDRDTGGIASLLMKGAETEFCRDILGRAAVMLDKSDTWSHDVFEFHDLEGYFTPVSIKKTEDGPVRSSIRVTGKYRNSTLVQTYTLSHNEGQLRVSARINWQEHFRCVKLQFPVRLDAYRGTYEIPFGTIEKDCNGLEEPMQRWMDLTGTQEGRGSRVGLAILNNGKYSASMAGSTLELTVLRSPIYAHHQPEILTREEDEYTYMDQGLQRFSYTLVPHTGDWQDCGIVKRAEELNQPCPAVIETYHRGPFPQRAQYIRIDQENIILTAFKKAHDGNGYVARFRETNGLSTKAGISMELFGQTISDTFGPYEIKTYRFCPGQKEPVEVNFLEWKL